MSRLWSLSELLDQFVTRIQRSWAGSQLAMSPQAILLVITLAIAALSFVLGSPLLFLIAVGQGAVIRHVFRGQRRPAIEATSGSVASAFAGLRERLPHAAAVQRVGFQVGTVIYRILYRLTLCLTISLSAGLATLSAFVLKQAELWQWKTLQAAGPPLGAVLVTGLVTVLALLMCGWLASRRPLLPR